MFKGLGNVLANPNVGICCALLSMSRGGLCENDPLRAFDFRQQRILRDEADAIFPNCPRYIHRMKIVEQSVFAACEGHMPPVPGWKKQPVFREVLPPGDSARTGVKKTGACRRPLSGGSRVFPSAGYPRACLT
jgi:hypothetical protein